MISGDKLAELLTCVGCDGELMRFVKIAIKFGQSFHQTCILLVWHLLQEKIRFIKEVAMVCGCCIYRRTAVANGFVALKATTALY